MILLDHSHHQQENNDAVVMSTTSEEDIEIVVKADLKKRGNTKAADGMKDLVSVNTEETPVLSPSSSTCSMSSSPSRRSPHIELNYSTSNATNGTRVSAGIHTLKTPQHNVNHTNHDRRQDIRDKENTPPSIHRAQAYSSDFASILASPPKLGLRSRARTSSASARVRTDIGSSTTSNLGSVDDLVRSSVPLSSSGSRSTDNVVSDLSKWSKITAISGRKKENDSSFSLLMAADSRFKVTWDRLTIFISILSFILSNYNITTRSYGQSKINLLCETWFFFDIILNFFTEHKTMDGEVIRDGKAVWARYLTSWFPIDVLSLVPWERIFVKPIVEIQNKRNIFHKVFRRTKTTIRVTRKLKGRHFKAFGRVASKTKHAGVGSRKLLTYLIKYIPKYHLFYKNMKIVLAVRSLRFVHWVTRIIKAAWVKTKTSATVGTVRLKQKFRKKENTKRSKSSTPARIRVDSINKSSRESSTDFY